MTKTKPAAIDLSDFEVVQAAIVDLRHPLTGDVLTDNGKPITLSIAGQDSDVFRDRQMEILDSRLKLAPGVRPSAEEVENERLETLARCIVGWDGIVYDGKPLEHSKDAARQLLQRLPWLREQVDLAIVNRVLHMKKTQAERAAAA